MALPLSLKPGRTRGVGTLHDPRIHVGLHVILPLGEGQNRTKLKKYIEEHHLAYNIDFEEGNLETFICRRPDGLTFDKEKNHVFS